MVIFSLLVGDWIQYQSPFRNILLVWEVSHQRGQYFHIVTEGLLYKHLRHLCNEQENYKHILYKDKYISLWQIFYTFSCLYSPQFMIWLNTLSLWTHFHLFLQLFQLTCIPVGPAITRHLAAVSQSRQQAFSVLAESAAPIHATSSSSNNKFFLISPWIAGLGHWTKADDDQFIPVVQKC